MDRDDHILDYVQNRLAPADRAQFEAEMLRDKALAAEVSLMQSVRADLADAPGHDADAGWERLSAALTPVPANDNRSPWMQILRYAAVAVLAVGVWQTAVVPRLGSERGFQPASEQSAGVNLQVKFIETATIGQITALLRGLDGTITEGPGALGLMMVSFADNSKRVVALNALGQNDLVELALEP